MHFTVREDGELLWKGREVPTMEQVKQVLQPIRYRKENHVKVRKILRKALSDVGFFVTSFHGASGTNLSFVRRKKTNWNAENKSEFIHYLMLRYLYKCPECFWTFHKRNSWQQATGVSEERRISLCQHPGLKHTRVPDRYEEALLDMGEPNEIPCSSRLAEGGDLCWFSTVYCLLVGKKR